MGLWTKTDASSGAPKNKDILGGPKAANGSALYQNTTSGAFIPGQAVGVFGVDSTEIHSTSNYGISHPGWVLLKFGTGPATSVTINAGGSGYANTDLIKISGGSANAAGTLTTNSTGGIATVTLSNFGNGFINVTSSTVAVTNSTGGSSAGSSANLSAVLGGRAGRKLSETLVAMKSLAADSATDDTVFP